MDYMDIGKYHGLFFGAVAAAHFLAVLGWLCYRYVNDTLPNSDEGAPWLKWFVDGEFVDTFAFSVLVLPATAGLFLIAWPLCWLAIFLFVFMKTLRYIIRLKKKVDQYHPED